MLSAIIGAAGSIAGGLLGSQDKRRDRQMQEKFAKNAIQWKAADALKAGIHPLYAMGAQTHSFAPVSAGGTDLGSGIAAAGQDLSRAVAATEPASTKASAYASSIQALTVQRMGLENQLLGSQIAKINQAGLTPPMPSPSDRYLIEGQTGAGLITTNPMMRTTVAPEATHQEPGAIPDVGHSRTASGGYAPLMSHDAKQRLEEDWPGMLMWNFRNRLLPSLQTNMSPPPFSPGPGNVWVYNPMNQEYIRMKAPYNFRKGGYAR